MDRGLTVYVKKVAYVKYLFKVKLDLWIGGTYCTNEYNFYVVIYINLLYLKAL